MDWGFEGLCGGPGGYGSRQNPWESYQPYETPYDEFRQHHPREYGYTASGRQGHGDMVALVHSGERYSISARELDVLQSPVYGANLRPLPRPISMPEAAQQLFYAHLIELTDAYEDAWDRVDEIWDDNLTWDLLIKMFNDLDTLVFHGDLRHRVRIQWADMRTIGEPALAFTEPPANYNVGRISIYMSSDTNWLQLPEGQALGVLLHEMLHAYFMVWCRDDTSEAYYERGQDPEHGEIYMRCARRIERKMRVDMTSGNMPESVGAEGMQGAYGMGQDAPMNYLGMQGAWSGGGCGMRSMNIFAQTMDPWGMPFFGGW